MPVPPQRATIATGGELAALFRTPPPALRLFMLLYFQAGLRFAETLRVTPSTYNPEKGTATVTIKGGRVRTVSLSPEICNLIAAAGTDVPADWPYIWALHGRRLGEEGLRGAWRRHKKKCGVNYSLVPHDLRRTAATTLYNETHDLRAAQELLGHKSLATTLRYLAPLHPDDAKKYAELLNFTHFKSEVKQ